MQARYRFHFLLAAGVHIILLDKWNPQPCATLLENRITPCRLRSAHSWKGDKLAQKVKLKDGREVVIRELNPDDVERSHEFFSNLPPEDRAYLRVDVTDHNIVEQRIRAVDRDRIRRLVAVYDDQIVADGTLESDGLQWDDHLAELRLIVAHPFQRFGLGMLMARELYFLAARKNVEEVVVKFMPPQQAARKIFTKLGFHEEAVLHEYVKDRNGHKQDLIIMRCNLQSLWEKLESYMHSSDWQRTR